MKAIKLCINYCSDPDFIDREQDAYSYAYRKLYQESAKLKDKEYTDRICSSFDLNQIKSRSLISEVSSRVSKTQTWKNETEEEIVSLIKEIKSLKEGVQSNKSRRKIIRLETDLRYKEKSLSKDIVFGGKDNLRKISHFSNKTDDLIREINRLKIILKKECCLSEKSNIKKQIDILEKEREESQASCERYLSDYKSNRKMSFFIMGEANQKGNRFFDFDFKSNRIIYKPEKGIKVIFEFGCYKTYKNDFKKLQRAINEKGISVSVFVSKDSISLAFDNAELNGYALDTKSRSKEVKEINSGDAASIADKKETIKLIYKKYYRDLESRMLKNKLYKRHASHDSNPEHISIAIMDKLPEGKGEKIVCLIDYDLTKLLEKLPKYATPEQREYINNKRKNQICNIWKDVFKTLAYYRCGHFVSEDLTIKDKDLGNTEANRKVNNCWHRTLSNELIDKYCQENGICQIPINPCYTSFIGNILHDFIDPINAAIEICRRGMYQFDAKEEGKKSKFYPEYSTGTIMNAMSRREPLRDVSFLKDCSNWAEAYNQIRTSGLRYRATLDEVKTPYQIVLSKSHIKIKKTLFFVK